VFCHILRVEEHRLVNEINLGLEKLASLKLSVKVGKPLLNRKLGLVVAEVMVEGRHHRRLLHAAQIFSETIGVIVAHLGV
jgi:hypothetical protein